MNTRIYLDHAATTPLDKKVFQKMTPYFTEIYGNADSPHAEGRKAMAAIDGARDTLAELLGAKKNEIYFTSGGTESDNWAILGAARAKKTRENKTHVLISKIEHHAALHAAETLEKEGFKVEYLPVNQGGRVALSDISERLRSDTALVCLMAANNETGVLQPIKETAALAHEKGALFFTDAVQLAPYQAIDVRSLGVDLLSMSSHKFYGPKGCGALYIKNGVKMEKLVGGGEQERGLRGGTLNVAAIVGMAEAYRIARAEMDENERKLQALFQAFMQKISLLSDIEQNGKDEPRLSAVLNLRIKGVENTALLYRMDLKGISLAAGSACASASIKPSHVLTAMGLDERAAKECVRISFGKNNTVEEIEQAAQTLIETVEKLRS
jgi:cysteine desulfurase